MLALPRDAPTPPPPLGGSLTAPYTTVAARLPYDKGWVAENGRNRLQFLASHRGGAEAARKSNEIKGSRRPWCDVCITRV
jgi:hypothetical protein